MTHLNQLWNEIHQRLPDIRAIITGSTPPPDGMPGTPSNPRRLPCNEHAFSLEEQITRRAAHWSGQPNPVQWMANNADQLMEQLGPEDQLALQTETIALAQEARQYEPANVKIRALTGKELERVHCRTIADVAETLETLGHKTPINTIKSWRKRGHLPKNGHGYSLQAALTKARESA